MNKQDLVRAVAEKLKRRGKKVYLETVEMTVDALFDTIAETVIKGDEVEVRGFGRFYLKKTGKRVARNPKTGEEIEIPPRKKFTFKASRKIRFPEEK